MVNLGLVPRYTKKTAYCGKCGRNLFPTEFDKNTMKPNFCRWCGEKINWGYMKLSEMERTIRQLVSEEDEKQFKKLNHLKVVHSEDQQGELVNVGYVLKIDWGEVNISPCPEATLEFLRKELCCQWIEAVPAPDGYIIVDEEYLLNNPPNRNILASRYSGNRLNGTAVLVNVWDDDFIPYTKLEAEILAEKIKCINDNDTNKCYNK